MEIKEILQIIFTGLIAIFTFALAVFTWKLWKVSDKQADTLKEQADISKQQTEILDKQTQIQNAQFEPDVEIYGFHKSEKYNNRLNFTIYIKNNGYSSVRIKDIKCENNSFKFFINYLSFTFPNRKEEKIKTLTFHNKVMAQKDGYEVSDQYHGKNDLVEDIILEFDKELSKLKNEEVTLKLCYRPRRAKAKDEFIYFKFKIGDVLDNPDGSTVKITDKPD